MEGGGGRRLKGWFLEEAICCICRRRYSCMIGAGCGNWDMFGGLMVFFFFLWLVG